VLRGSAWNVIAGILSSVARERILPVLRYDGTGMRIARTH